MSVTMRVEGLDKLAASFGQLPNRVQAGVKLRGPAVAYGLSWEFGSSRISKPGPKTTWGTNPDGKRVILTQTAPRGWIRVNTNQYRQFVRAEFANTDFNRYPVNRWKVVIAELLYRAAKKCAALMEETAPVDTGALRSQIVAVNEPDPILEEGTFNDYGPTHLELDWQ